MFGEFTNKRCNILVCCEVSECVFFAIGCAIRIVKKRVSSFRIPTTFVFKRLDCVR